MRDRKPGAAITNDTRGVSEVVGFILIFAILILALTTYQAAIVPQQNAQTEFQHFEDVRNEMIELRNAVSTAGQADVSQFPSVTLGTNYRTRTLTINPPDPAGTLKTSDRSYNITVSNGTPEHDLNITTRFLEYQPGYNEISIGSMRYEHSVLYLDERDRGGVSIIQEQNIVKDGKVRITALQKQFQETGTGRVTLELYPQDEVNRSAFPNGNGRNLTVRVPTRLSEDEYWNESLNDTGDMYHGVESGRLNLSVNETDLRVNTVGIRGEPDEGPAKNVDSYIGGGDGGNDVGDGGGGSGDPSFESFTADRTGKNSIEYSFDISPGGADLTSVEVRVENSNSGNIIKTDLYDENTNAPPFDSSGFSVSDGSFNGLGNPGEADVVFEATDTDGGTETERVEDLTS